MTTRTNGSDRARTVGRAVAAVGVVAIALAGCRQPSRPAPGTSTAFATQAQEMQRTSPDRRPWFCNASGQGTPPSGHGNGAHVNPHYAGKTKGPLDWTDCLKLAGQLDQTMNVLKGYETKAKGERAGAVQVAPYVPGLGTHHTKIIGGAAAFDPAKPAVLIYGGETPDAPLVGVAFIAPVTAAGSAPPEAYAGGNDWWHLHTQTCLGLDVRKFPDPGDMSAEECRATGGTFQKIFPAPDGSARGVWLLHAWFVQPHEYRPDLFVSGHPCMLDTAPAPQGDPCWESAHRDPATIPTPPPTTGTDPDHGGHGH